VFYETRSPILEVNNLGPWAKGLLKGMPAAAAGPAALVPVAKYPLVLAEERTRRPDVLQHLKMYGGWNVTNKHYWAVCVVVVVRILQKVSCL
jgi:hypothetical protein